MCGGAPSPSPEKKVAPPPAPPAELILSKDEQGAAAAKKGKRQKKRGRSALVTPGLSLGSAAATRTVSGVGIKSAATRAKTV
jgi:hypothetical protein